MSGTRLAVGADPENIRLVAGDGESVAVGHPGRPQVDPAGVDLDDPSATLANQMMMVDGIAEPEPRLAGFPPEHVNPSRLHQPLKGPVDGCQPDRAAEVGVSALFAVCTGVTSAVIVTDSVTPPAVSTSRPSSTKLRTASLPASSSPAPVKRARPVL